MPFQTVTTTAMKTVRKGAGLEVAITVQGIDAEGNVSTWVRKYRVAG